jgi:hypothetical protein
MPARTGNRTAPHPMSPRLQKLIGITLLWATLGVAAVQTLF